MKAKTRLKDVYNKDAYVPFSIDGLQGAILLDELVNDPQLKEWYDAILTNGGMIQNIGGEQLADDSYKLVVTTLNTTGTTSEKEFIIGKATADALLLETETREQADTALEAKITEEKNARIAKDDVVFTVTKDTINDAETVGDANWAWALTPSVSDEELNARIAKRANFYVDVSLDTLGFLPYLKYIKLESIPENTNGVFSGLIPPASEFGYVETTNIKVKYNAKHKRWIALFYGADYIIPTVTSKKNGLMSKSDKAKLDALPTRLTTEQTARVQADKTLQTNIDALKATATADANGLMSKEDKVKLDSIDTDTTNYLTLEFTGITTDADNAKMNIANAVLKNPPLYADVKKVIDDKGFIYLKYNADGIDYCFAGAYAGYNERAIVFYIPNINILADSQGEQHINNINMQPIQCAITPDKSSNPIVQCELIECSDAIVNQLLMFINPAIMCVDGNEDGFTTIWTKQALKTQIDNGKRIYISPKPSSETIKKYPICYGFATSAKHGNNYYVTFNTIDKDSSPIQVVFYTTDDSTQLKVSVKGIATKEDIAKEATARTEADKVLTANLAKEVTDRTNAVNAEATAREQADTAINGEIQGIKDKGTLHDLFLGLGAEYDNSTNSYTYCDNTGLSLDDLIQAYYCTYNWWNAPNIKGAGSGPINVKCIFRPKEFNTTYYNIYNFMQSFNGLGVKIIDLSATSRVDDSYKVICVSSFDFAFQGSTRIEEIRNVFDVSKCNTIRMSKALAKCKLLLFKNVKTNVDIKDLPLLNKRSILYMITKATPSSPITITLHPTAYAMATADQEIQAELEKQPNISLAEGEPTA